MVKIQLDLPEEQDAEVRHYMIDKKIIDKRDAIIEIIKRFFQKGGKR